LGDRGEVFLLDMGSPIKIVDLARQMIRLSGKSEQEVPIVFTGSRPGEKLFEELRTDAEDISPTGLRKIFRCAPGTLKGDRFDAVIDRLEPSARRLDEAAVRDCLRAL